MAENCTLDGWECDFQRMVQWLPRAGRQTLVIVVLALAGLCMVLAWIYHLKHRLTFPQAFGLSLALVAVEFALNTWITRFSLADNLFLPGQLAMISIVSGILVLAVLMVTIFHRQHNGFDWSAGLGFVLVLVAAVLLLRHQQF